MNCGYDNRETSAATENTQHISMYPYNFADSYEDNPEKKFHFICRLRKHLTEQKRFLSGIAQITSHLFHWS